MGDNADTDDDNDGTPDAADDKPYDAFPLDDSISVAKIIDQRVDCLEELVTVTELTITGSEF